MSGEGRAVREIGTSATEYRTEIMIKIINPCGSGMFSINCPQAEPRYVVIIYIDIMTPRFSLLERVFSQLSRHIIEEPRQ